MHAGRLRRRIRCTSVCLRPTHCGKQELHLKVLLTAHCWHGTLLYPGISEPPANESPYLPADTGNAQTVVAHCAQDAGAV
jgi:hypothetical protein